MDLVCHQRNTGAITAGEGGRSEGCSHRTVAPSPAAAGSQLPLHSGRPTVQAPFHEQFVQCGMYNVCHRLVSGGCEQRHFIRCTFSMPLGNAKENSHFFYSNSCYGFFAPLEMTSMVDDIHVAVVVVGNVGRPSQILPNPRKR